MYNLNLGFLRVQYTSWDIIDKIYEKDSHLVSKEVYEPVLFIMKNTIVNSIEEQIKELI